MNGGQIVVDVLRKYGIQKLFTLSGGHIAPIYVEAEKAGLQVIDVRHEASAVFAADALARMSGIPGVALVTAGPGVTNTITALKNAQMAQSPVLLIGGAPATLLKGRGALQDIDQKALVRPHVKYLKRITRLKDLAPTLHEGLKTALSGVPGPVFIECPVDLLYDQKIVEGMYGQGKTSSKSIMAKIRNWYINRHVKRLFSGTSSNENSPDIDGFHSSQISASVFNEIRQLLDQCKKPVLLMGSGAMLLPKKADELARSVEQLGIPVYLSGMARGLLGKASSIQYYHKRTLALKESDCILLAGVPCDFRLNYGSHFKRKSIKITINRSAVELKKNIKPNKAIKTDPGLFLIELAKTKAQYSEKWKGWRDVLQERESKREEEITRLSQTHSNGINPLALFRNLEKKLPDNSVIIVDGGDFAASASYTLKPRGPLKWLDPGVFGTLGSGGGFALGAALQYPDHHIWIIYGDGSAAYSLMEMDTFHKFGMKVCGIIGNNGSWEQIAREQLPILGMETATSLPQSDYEKIAHAFGVKGTRVSDLDSFDESVSQALREMKKGNSYLINAIIGSSDFRKGSISM